MVRAVKKPWGEEYLLYQNDNVAIWHLYIHPKEQTSLHSHPNKKTGLLVLDGVAKIRFLSNEQVLFAGDKTMIRHGVFHQTYNPVRCMLQLLEIETPVDKTDIVRLEDDYGRAGTTNMGDDAGEVYRIPDLKNSCIVGDCLLYHTSIDNVTVDDYDHVMITSGCISSFGQNVCEPGDIISTENFKIMSSKFDVHNIEGIWVKSCL